MNAQGEVYFSDVSGSKIHKVALDGTVSVFAEKTGGANGLMFDAQGRLLACQMRAGKLARYDAAGNVEILLEGVSGNDITVLPDGSGYFTAPRDKKIWHFNGAMETREFSMDFDFPNGIIPTADHAFVWVNDRAGPWVYSYQRQADGALAHGQRYGYLHCPDADDESVADGMTVDDQGRLYVATKLGVQVMDQLGQVHLILNNPHPDRKKLSNVVFGGAELDTLYVTCTDKVYKRRLKAKGVVPSRGPVSPPKPGL
ncbi:MAG: gluconolactonase [Verrucomicrobiales bacterium]